MTAPRSQPDNREVRDYVIKRNGGFYRPNAAGYCLSIRDAGRYSQAEALAHQMNVEGVTIHHVSEFPPDEIAALKSQVEELTKALRDIQAKTNGDRPTVHAGNAFHYWQQLNKTIIDIRERCGVALSLEGRGGAT